MNKVYNKGSIKMCGIAGFYNPNINFGSNPKDNFKILNNMVKSIKRRGPDGDGTKIINSCCLAHTRLSIIDLDKGSQPMSLSFNGNKYHIIYNGEIYNHKILKQGLISEGYTFNTTSDTEVILNMFIKYGPGFVSKLNGIFAIAIYDDMPKEYIENAYKAASEFDIPIILYS